MLGNLRNLKNNRVYTKPSSDNIAEYNLKVTQSRSKLENDKNDIDLSNMFVRRHDLTNKGIPFKIAQSEFSGMLDENGAPIDGRALELMIRSVAKESDVDKRNKFLIAVNKSEKKELFARFIANEGALLLSDWLSLFLTKLEAGSELASKEFELIRNILKLVTNLPLTIEDLKNSKVGSRINKLGKHLKFKELKLICESLVAQWKDLIEGSTAKVKKSTKSNNLLDHKRARSPSPEMFAEQKAKPEESKQFPLIASIPQRPIGLARAPLKSILKKNPLASKKPVRFNEKQMERVRIFKDVDAPSSGELNMDEYENIQRDLLTDQNTSSKEKINFRMRELIMEKENFAKKKKSEEEKLAATKNMYPQTFFPPKIKELVFDSEYSLSDPSEAHQIDVLRKLTEESLTAHYYREQDIPRDPSMGLQKVFDFFDASIPKIENRIVAPKADVKIVPVTQELLQEIKNAIKVKDDNTDWETRNKIMDLLKIYTSKGKITISELEELTKLIEKLPDKKVNSFPMMTFQPPTFVNPIITSPNAMMSLITANITNKEIGAGFVRKPEEMNRPPNFRTKPCRNFHSSLGCNRGEMCHFIHDPEFAGTDIPNFSFNEKYQRMNSDNQLNATPRPDPMEAVRQHNKNNLQNVINTQNFKMLPYEIQQQLLASMADGKK